MIQQTSFLGIPLRTAAQRRGFVLGYYLLLFSLAVVPLYLHKQLPVVVLMQTFTLGGLLGGIKFGGPVKPYTGSINTAGLDGSGITQLDLSQRRQTGIMRLLDERELYQRDHAHYTAFRILRFSLAIVTVVCWVIGLTAPSLLLNNASTLLWMLLMFVLSLPQSVILWTEPAPVAENSLTLVHPQAG